MENIIRIHKQVYRNASFLNLSTECKETYNIWTVKLT